MTKKHSIDCVNSVCMVLKLKTYSWMSELYANTYCEYKDMQINTANIKTILADRVIAITLELPFLLNDFCM